MGITGLLPIIKPVMERRHIRQYRSARVGIDGHVWLHWVASLVAPELFHKGGTDKHVPILVKRIEALASQGITPVMVFDGDPGESKAETARERAAQRARARTAAEFFLARNDVMRAKEMMRRAVGITPGFLAAALSGLRAAGIEYIVAPYEADPQLVHLQRIGYIDWIMTIDSDLIAYGASRILYNYTGAHVDEYDASRLPLARDCFFAENILDICILSGCDYAASIRGVGLSTAHKKLMEHGSVVEVVAALRRAGKPVPADYLTAFGKAKTTFLHHIVYNPLLGARQHLSGAVRSEEFLGTLEDLPFVVETQLGDGLRIGRHFKPSDRPRTAETSCKETVQANVDPSLTSKYF